MGVNITILLRYMGVIIPQNGPMWPKLTFNVSNLDFFHFRWGGGEAILWSGKAPPQAEKIDSKAKTPGYNTMKYMETQPR